MAAKTPTKEFYKRVLISMLDVAKTGSHVSARQHLVGTLSAIARDLGFGKKPRREAGKACRLLKTVRASVKPAVFIHISLAIARSR